MSKFLILSAAILAIVFVVALGFLQFGVPFSIFQQGAEAPMVVELSGNPAGKELTEGAKLQLRQGESLQVELEGSWWNRSLSPNGLDNAGGAWFVDGEFVELIDGGTKSVSRIYVRATDPAVGAFIEDQWSWQTLPILATLPSQGQTVSFARSFSFDTSNLDIGSHQFSVRVFSINGSSNVAIFSDGGVCFPLQPEEQGFPCAGIYGTTQRRSKTNSPRCIEGNNPYWGVVYRCPSLNWNCGSCGSWCCYNWTGGGEERCINWNAETWCKCSSPYVNWSDWGDWSVMVEQTKEEATTNLLKEVETVAVLNFEIVKECETECCFEQEGFLDKPCPDNGLCSNGNCATVIEECPSACCIGEEGFYDKECPAGLICQSNQCISIAPPPPPPEDYSAMLIIILIAAAAIAVLFIAALATNR